MRVGAHGRRYFGSVGPVGLLLLAPLLLAVWAIELVVVLARLGWFLIVVVARMLLGSVLWVVAHQKSRRETECRSRRDEGSA